MHLLSEIEKYLRASGTTPTRFGRNVVRDPRFVHDLRRGREPGYKLTKRVMTFLESVR
jgi:hypothetical protein